MMAFMDTTSASLLIRLQSADGDTMAWNRFVELYTPLIFYWARKAGLQSVDARDLVQEVLASLVRKLPEFRHDPTKSFRGWLRTVTLNKHRELARRKRVHLVEVPISELGNIPEKAREFWDTEYKFHLVAQAMKMAEPMFESSTWQALKAYVQEEATAAEAAKLHNLSIWTVYSAKSRLLAYLRENLDGLLD